MHTDTTIHLDFSTPVRGYVLPVSGVNVGYLRIGPDENYVTMILRDPAFLDKLSNEADRLSRELVGDVPTTPRPTAGQILSAAYPAEVLP